MKYAVPVSLMSIALFAFVLVGCGSKEPATKTTPAAKAGHADDGHDDHGDHKESGKTDMEKMEAELAKLSTEDAASAKKQHMCPVTGEMLGSMGAPLKVDVKGQPVWICCKGCKKDLLENPDKFLAKLKK